MAQSKKYTPPTIKVPSKQKKTAYLVRHVSSTKDTVSHVGPFLDKEEALTACKHFLKNGTCSWLVTCGNLPNE